MIFWIFLSSSPCKRISKLSCLQLSPSLSLQPCHTAFHFLRHYQFITRWCAPCDKLGKKLNRNKVEALIKLPVLIAESPASLDPDDMAPRWYKW